ncbi:putative serpin-Z12 [Hordeum vulgare]|nr:putative serpin-Z12 [Hordeum vulgare]
MYAVKHTVSLDRGTYAGTCDGLVLLADDSAHSNGARSVVDGVVFNPTTKEEVRFSLMLSHAREDVDCRFLGFG